MTQDEQTLQDLVKNLEDAWNAADHVGFTAPFADHAIFIHIYGGQLDGRAAIGRSTFQELVLPQRDDWIHRRSPARAIKGKDRARRRVCAPPRLRAVRLAPAGLRDRAVLQEDFRNAPVVVDGRTRLR